MLEAPESRASVGELLPAACGPRRAGLGRAPPALFLPGFCPLGPLDRQCLIPTSQSDQGSPVLTVVLPRFCVLSTEGFHTGT